MERFRHLWKRKKTVLGDWGNTEYKIVANWTPREVKGSRPQEDPKNEQDPSQQQDQDQDHLEDVTSFTLSGSSPRNRAVSDHEVFSEDSRHPEPFSLDSFKRGSLLASTKSNDRPVSSDERGDDEGDGSSLHAEHSDHKDLIAPAVHIHTSDEGNFLHERMEGFLSRLRGNSKDSGTLDVRGHSKDSGTLDVRATNTKSDRPSLTVPEGNNIKHAGLDGGAESGQEEGGLGQDITGHESRQQNMTVTDLKQGIFSGHESRQQNSTMDVAGLGQEISGRHESRLKNSTMDVAGLGQEISGRHESRLKNSTMDVAGLGQEISGRHESRLKNDKASLLLGQDLRRGKDALDKMDLGHQTIGHDPGQDVMGTGHTLASLKGTDEPLSEAPIAGRKRRRPSLKNRAKRKKGSSEGSSYPAKLWQTGLVKRTHKDLNELDICLSIYDNVVRDTIESTDDVVVQRYLADNWKKTAKWLLSVIKDYQMIHELEKRLRMEKAKSGKQNKRLVTSLNSLQRANRDYQIALAEVKQADRDEKMNHLKNDILSHTRELRPLISRVFIQQRTQQY